MDANDVVRASRLSFWVNQIKKYFINLGFLWSVILGDMVLLVPSILCF